MVRTSLMLGAALAGALACAGAQAQGPVTERQAASYIRGGFLTDSAHAILSREVKLGPELQRRLALPPGADSRAIYDALVALIDPSDLAVRRAGGEPRQPLFALESGDTTLLIQYDLQANNIPFVDQIASPVKPIVAKKPAPPAAAATPKTFVIPPAQSIARIPGITPYRIDIQQGNNVSQEAVVQLKPGMSKDQVRALLGTPLLTAIFHAERWDYVYFREQPDGKREQRRLTVFFEGGRLARLDGDVAARKEAN